MKGSFLIHTITVELCSRRPYSGKEADRADTVMNTVKHCDRGEELQKALH